MATPQEKTRVATALVGSLSGMKYIYRGYVENGVDSVAPRMGIILTDEERTEIAERAKKAIIVLGFIEKTGKKSAVEV